MARKPPIVVGPWQGSHYCRLFFARNHQVMLVPTRSQTLLVDHCQEPTVVVGVRPGTVTCGILVRNQPLLLGLGQEPTVVVGSWPGTNDCRLFVARNQQWLFVSRPRTDSCVWFQAKNQPLLVLGQGPTILVGSRRGTHKCWCFFGPEPTIIGSRPGTINCCWFIVHNHCLLLARY